MSGREAEKKRRGHKRRNEEASAFLEGLGSRSFEEKGRRRSALAALKPWNSFFFSFLLSASRALSLSLSLSLSHASSDIALTSGLHPCRRSEAGSTTREGT